MKSSKSPSPWLLLAPMLIVMGGVIGWPFIRTIAYSFTNAKLIAFEPPKLTYLQNYINALTNPEFRQAMGISLKFAIVVVSAELLMGISIGLLLNCQFYGRRIVRAMLIIPWALPTVVNAIMWRLIYNPEYGALNSLLYQMGFINEYQNWLSNRDLALWAIIFADLWKNFSLVALIVLAALQTLPHEQIESAQIDGAGPFQRFKSVIFPHILPPLQVALVLRIIEAVKVFDIVFIMTRGGPMNLTRTGSIFVYQEAFSNSRMGPGASYAFIMVLVIFIFISLYMKGLKKGGGI